MKTIIAIAGALLLAVGAQAQVVQYPGTGIGGNVISYLTNAYPTSENNNLLYLAGFGQAAANTVYYKVNANLFTNTTGGWVYYDEGEDQICVSNNVGTCLYTAGNFTTEYSANGGTPPAGTASYGTNYTLTVFTNFLPNLTIASNVTLPYPAIATVETNGNDSTAQLGQGMPFRTLRRATEALALTQGGVVKIGVGYFAITNLASTNVSYVGSGWSTVITNTSSTGFNLQGVCGLQNLKIVDKSTIISVPALFNCASYATTGVVDHVFIDGRSDCVYMTGSQPVNLTISNSKLYSCWDTIFDGQRGNVQNGYFRVFGNEIKIEDDGGLYGGSRPSAPLRGLITLGGDWELSGNTIKVSGYTNGNIGVWAQSSSANVRLYNNTIVAEPTGGGPAYQVVATNSANVTLCNTAATRISGSVNYCLETLSAYYSTAGTAVNWTSNNLLSGTVVLSAGQQNYWITNTAVTANCWASVVVNTSDATATSAMAIVPSAGLLQLRTVAAATGNTRLSWEIRP